MCGPEELSRSRASALRSTWARATSRSTVPLFRLAQDPMPLDFSLDYHSERPMAPGLVSSPLGPGWSHSFSDTLRPLGPGRNRLYRITPEGYEEIYQRQADGSWQASSPGELRARVVASGGELLRTDLDGTVTAYDAASGDWLSTTDRWGNRIAGSYDASGHLATVTDTEGRTLTFGYDGDHLASVELPGGETWTFDYRAGILSAIHDPLHPGATPWRSFEYQADSEGVPRLLTALRDESGALLEGHAYDARDRGTSSYSEGGRDLVSVEYDTPSPGKTRVVSAIDAATSQTSVFTLHYQHGRYLPTEILGNCPTCGGATSDDQTYTYTSSNRIASRVDARGHRTAFTYDANANLTSETEAVGSPEERTTRYRYDDPSWPNFRTQLDEPSVAQPGSRKITTFSWNADETELTVAGVRLPRGERRLAHHLHDRHHLRRSPPHALGRRPADRRGRRDEPDVLPRRRSRPRPPWAPRDVDGCRRPHDHGLTTTTTSGPPGETTDPNGVVTRRETDDRGRLTSSTSARRARRRRRGERLHHPFVFDGRDRLVRTVLPRGNAVAYGYEDGTNRLVDTIRVDAAGQERERRHLTLNDIGDRTAEEDQVCDTPAASCASWTTKHREGLRVRRPQPLDRSASPGAGGLANGQHLRRRRAPSTVQDENHATPNTTYTYDALHRLKTIAQTLAGGARRRGDDLVHLRRRRQPRLGDRSQRQHHDLPLRRLRSPLSRGLAGRRDHGEHVRPGRQPALDDRRPGRHDDPHLRRRGPAAHEHVHPGGPAHRDA